MLVLFPKSTFHILIVDQVKGLVKSCKLYVPVPVNFTELSIYMCLLKLNVMV